MTDHCRPILLDRPSQDLDSLRDRLDRLERTPRYNPTSPPAPYSPGTDPYRPTYPTDYSNPGDQMVGGGGSGAGTSTRVPIGSDGAFWIVDTSQPEQVRWTNTSTEIVWDDTNNRLGIGTIAPQNKLHLKNTIPAYSTIRLEGSTGYTLLQGGGDFSIRASAATPVATFSLTDASMNLGFSTTTGARLVLLPGAGTGASINDWGPGDYAPRLLAGGSVISVGGSLFAGIGLGPGYATVQGSGVAIGLPASSTMGFYIGDGTNPIERARLAFGFRLPATGTRYVQMRDGIIAGSGEAGVEFGSTRSGGDFYTGAMFGSSGTSTFVPAGNHGVLVSVSPVGSSGYGRCAQKLWGLADGNALVQVYNDHKQDGTYGPASNSPSAPLTFQLEGMVEMMNVPVPNVSPSARGRIYFDGINFKASENGGAYVNLVGAGGGGGSGTASLTVVAEQDFNGTASTAGTALDVTFSKGSHTHGTPSPRHPQTGGVYAGFGYGNSANNGLVIVSRNLTDVGSGLVGNNSRGTYLASWFALNGHGRGVVETVSLTDGTAKVSIYNDLDVNGAYGEPGTNAANRPIVLDVQGPGSSILLNGNNVLTSTSVGGLVTTSYTFGQNANNGSATTAAASDHVHGTPPLGASVVGEFNYGQTALIGTATSAAHTDHSHGTPSLSNSVTSETAFGQAAVAGSSNYASHGDHSHGTPPAPANYANNYVAKGDIFIGTGPGTFNRLTPGSNGTFIIADSATANGTRWTTASEVVVTSTGVGIGYSPAYKLDVNGDIRANGNLRAQGGGSFWYTSVTATESKVRCQLSGDADAGGIGIDTSLEPSPLGGATATRRGLFFSPYAATGYGRAAMSLLSHNVGTAEAVFYNDRWTTGAYGPGGSKSAFRVKVNAGDVGGLTYDTAGIYQISAAAACTYAAQNSTYTSCLSFRSDGKWYFRFSDNSGNNTIQCATVEQVSSRDYKRSIRPAPKVRHRLRKLAPRVHKSLLLEPVDGAEHNPTALLNANQDRFSLIVEELVEHFPELVAYNDEDGRSVPRAIDTGSAIGFLMHALSEADAEIDRLAAIIDRISKTPTMKRELASL